jgi:hypothetical protein
LLYGALSRLHNANTFSFFFLDSVAYFGSDLQTVRMRNNQNSKNLLAFPADVVAQNVPVCGGFIDLHAIIQYFESAQSD